MTFRSLRAKISLRRVKPRHALAPARGISFSRVDLAAASQVARAPSRSNEEIIKAAQGLAAGPCAASVKEGEEEWRSTREKWDTIYGAATGSPVFFLSLPLPLVAALAWRSIMRYSVLRSTPITCAARDLLPPTALNTRNR